MTEALLWGSRLQPSETMLSNIYHTGSVTALCCHDKTVLAGIGSCLYIYSVPDASNKFCVEVLHGRNVHGIRPESCSGRTRLCLYGQKCIRLLSYDPASFQASPLTSQIELKDWIWDVKWLQDVPALSLALGHNSVALFDYQQEKVVEAAHCQEKCIIYCAKFITDRKEELVLAAGTVFNQVVIWSPVGKLDSQGRRQVIHRLTGHQGVIFSIDYEPWSQRICSASDDRSIILYQVKFPQPTTSPCLEDWENMDSSPLHVLFGHSARVWDVRLLTSVFVSVGEDSTCCVWSYDGHVVQKFKGHKGKSIWSLAVDREKNSVVTGGGDHSIRLWNIQQQQAGPAAKETSSVIPLQIPDEDFPRNTLLLDLDRALVLTNMGNLLFFNHVTKKTTSLMSNTLFYSYSVIAVSQSGRLIAVGNIHGTLRLFSCTDALWENIRVVSSLDVSLYKGRLFSVNWLDETTLLTTGPDGVLNLCEVEVDPASGAIGCEVGSDLDLPPSRHRWVSAVAYSPNGDCIVCGDRMGSVYLYSVAGEKQSERPRQTFPKIHGKAGVTSVGFHGNHVYTTGRDSLYRVFAWTEDQELQLLNSNRVYKGFEWLESLAIEDDDVLVQGFHSNMFVVWSVQNNQKLMEVECGGGHRAWAFCRHGNRAQFVYIKSREVVLKDIDIQPSQTILKGSLHGRELCDAKYLCTGPSKEDTCDIIVTCSEDTTICISALDYSCDITALRVLGNLSGHISSVRCLSVCPSSLPAQQPEAQSKLIFSGGGRAQMRVSRVNIRFQTALKDTLTDSGKESLNQHSEIDSTKNLKEILPQGSLDVNESCSGDVGDHDVNCTKDALLTCDKIADTMHAAKAPAMNAECVVKGCDKPEVTAVRCDVENLAVCQLGQSGRRRKKPWRHNVEYSDPETRILDISAFPGQELDKSVPDCLFFLSTACSDGLVRFFAFDERTRAIHLLASSSFHDHCVLKTCHVTLTNTNQTDTFGHVTNQGDHVTSENNHNISEYDIEDHVTANRINYVIVLTAATDGMVAFWDMTEIFKQFTCDSSHEGSSNNSTRKDKTKAADDGKRNTEISPVFTLRLHQSGINSIHVSKMPDGRYMLITGGDDNAVNVNIVTMDTKKGQLEVKIVSSGSDKRAHAAQIIGVWCMSPTAILTASIDQRMSIWTVTEEHQDIKLSLVDCRFVDVMDIANIDVWTHWTKHRVVLSGDGLQVLDVDLGNSDGRPFQPVQTATLAK